MKTISWIGGIVLVSGVALTALLAGASAGDVVYIHQNASVTLTAGGGSQAAKLADVILDMFPTADTATVQDFRCLRRATVLEDGSAGPDEIMCRGNYLQTITAAQFARAEVDGTSLKAISAGGGNVTILRKVPFTKAGASAITKLGTFVTSVWAVDAQTFLDFKCRRVDSDIVCDGTHVDTATPEDYATLKLAGSVVRPLGLVE